MPLETGNSIPDLNASNPAHTDGIGAGDAHIRLIKSVLKNTFPNFTNASLTSTQAQIDAAVTALAGTFKAVDGTISAPAYSFASEATLGFYRKATNTLALSISGIDVWKISGGGVDVITAGALLAGGTPIFPLATANIGAAQVTNAKIAPAAVTYGLNGSLQLSAAANVLLGSTTIGGFFGEITMGSGIGIVSGALTNTSPFSPLPSVLNLAIDNNVSSPTTKIDVSCDGCVLIDGSGNAQRFFNVAVTLDFATTGANGCDTGTRAANKGYYVYLIGNGTTAAALASLDTTTSPVFPTGYTAVKRVGWYRTDGSSNLVKIRTRGGNAVYTVSPFTSIAAGASAGANAAITGLVAPNAYKGLFIVSNNNSNVSVGPNSSTVTYSCANGGTLVVNATVEMMFDSGVALWYSGSAGSNVGVRGWSFPQ